MLQRIVRSVAGSVFYAARFGFAFVSFFVVAATTAAAVTTGDAWPSPAAERALTCPKALVLESAGGRDYLFAVGANGYSTVFLDVIFFTASGEYEVTMPSFRIDRPSEARAGTFRSAGVIVEAPADEPFLGASIAGIGTACGAVHALVTSVTDRSPEADHDANLLAGVRRDAIPTVGTIHAKRVAGSKPLPCARPFQAARAIRGVPPNYPEIAREQGAVGTAVVHVDLDAAGKVTGSERYVSAGNTALDSAALQSAYATTYSPAIFACRPDIGSFTLPITFTTQ